MAIEFNSFIFWHCHRCLGSFSTKVANMALSLIWASWQLQTRSFAEHLN